MVFIHAPDLGRYKKESPKVDTKEYKKGDPNGLRPRKTRGHDPFSYPVLIYIARKNKKEFPLPRDQTGWMI
jgi:hypothetical protein